MTAVAVAALVVAPAFAQSPGSPAGAKKCRRVTKRSASLCRSPKCMTPAREANIRECNTLAAKTYQVRDSNWPILITEPAWYSMASQSEAGYPQAKQGASDKV
jgi:hypothetical protein